MINLVYLATEKLTISLFFKYLFGISDTDFYLEIRMGKYLVGRISIGNIASGI